ncbi:DUF4465 domain-containing protein [Bacteroidota bacterium]
MKKLLIISLMILGTICSFSQHMADFEDLNLEPDSFWNGSDLSGSFNSNGFTFVNYYNADYDSWSGWSYSNKKDDSTAGFINQYSAFTASGYDGSDNYGVANGFGDIFITFDSSYLEGVYITNSTYTALSILNGDAFAKKFGDSTNAPDWFKLDIIGFMHDSVVTDTVHLYLADYRFADSNEDYIVSEWTWVDLSPLGKINKLKFQLSSSDVGMWGMNTPAYFCIDQLTVVGNPTIIPGKEQLSPVIFPNPFINQIQIINTEEIEYVRLYDSQGAIVFVDNSTAHTFLLNYLDKGLYIIEIKTKMKISFNKILKL